MRRPSGGRRRSIAGGRPAAGGERRRSLERASDTVTRTLHAYASRGVFRGFSVRDQRDGRRTYTFLWLTRRPMTVRFDPRSDSLDVPALFPQVEAGGTRANELTRMVDEASSRRLPAHKRLDPRRGALTCSVRNGALSLRLAVRGGSHAYSVRYLMNLVNDLFVRLQETDPDYLAAEFGVSGE